MTKNPQEATPKGGRTIEPPGNKISPTCFQGFLPRSNSKVIFILVMSCYAIALTTVETRLVQLLRAWPAADKSIKQAVTPMAPPISQSRIVDLLLLSPVGESLIMIAVIEGVRRMRLTTGVQVVTATCVICLFHSLRLHAVGFYCCTGIFDRCGHLCVLATARICMGGSVDDDRLACMF